MSQVILLSLTASLNPTLVAATTVMLLLRWVAGLRRGEAVTLRMADVHLAESSREIGCSEPGPHLHMCRREDLEVGAAKSLDQVASVHAFQVGIGISAALVALGGTLGLAGIRNPRRGVRGEDCPGGQLPGQPMDAGRHPERMTSRRPVVAAVPGATQRGGVFPLGDIRRRESACHSIASGRG